jgi:hypothetical protein
MEDHSHTKKTQKPRKGKQKENGGQKGYTQYPINNNTDENTMEKHKDRPT